MEIEQTPRCLRIKVNGVQWIVINFSLGILLIFASVILLVSGKWIELFWGACLLLSGSVMVLVALFSTPLRVIYTFDKTVGIVRSENKAILSSKVIEWRLQDIQSIQVDAQEDSDRTTHYVINLVSTSGQHLQLREVEENTNPQEYEQVAERIRQFLKLP